MKFNSLFNADPNESDAAEKLTEASFTDIAVGDPRRSPTRRSDDSERQPHHWLFQILFSARPTGRNLSLSLCAMQKRNLIATRLEVTSMVAGGDGLAHVVHGDERRAVFVPRGAPGDILEAEVDFTCKPARATSIRLLEPSRLRASAPCPHVERCGGCDFMHLTLEAQVAAHRDIVGTALARAIRSSSNDATMPEIVSHTAPRDVGYRTRARLSVVAAHGHATVGYRRAGSHRIEEVSSCAVLDPLLDASWRTIRELFAGEQGEGRGRPCHRQAGRPGSRHPMDRQSVGRVSSAASRPTSTKVPGAGGEVRLEGARDPARVGDPRAVTTGADGAPLIVPSGGFAQAHPAMNQKLGERIAAGFPVEGRDVVELFAGSGNLTVVIARNAGSVLAVESEARAVAAARENLQARGLAARVVQADAGIFDVPPAIRAVLLDPPRAGAADASEKLGALSCSARRLCLLRSIDPRA